MPRKKNKKMNNLEKKVITAGVLVLAVFILLFLVASVSQNAMAEINYLKKRIAIETTQSSAGLDYVNTRTAPIAQPIDTVNQTTNYTYPSQTTSPSPVTSPSPTYPSGTTGSISSTDTINSTQSQTGATAPVNQTTIVNPTSPLPSSSGGTNSTVPPSSNTTSPLPTYPVNTGSTVTSPSPAGTVGTWETTSAQQLEAQRQQIEQARLAEEARLAAEAKAAEEARIKMELENARLRALEEARLAQIIKQKAEENARLAAEAKRQAEERAKQAAAAAKQAAERARLVESENQKKMAETKLAEEKLRKEAEALKLQSQQTLLNQTEAEKQKAYEAARLIEEAKRQAIIAEKNRSEAQLTNALQTKLNTAAEATRSQEESILAQEDLERANKDVKKAEIAADQAGILVDKVNDASNKENLREVRNILNASGIELVAQPAVSAATARELLPNLETLTGKSLIIKIEPAKTTQRQPNVVVKNIDQGVILTPTMLEVKAVIANNPLAQTAAPVGLTVLPAAETVKEELAEGEASKISPVVMTLDSDGDGLADEMEKAFGTDINNTDSDGDGYSDYVEIKNSYNPLGKGKKDADLKPAEKAIINRAAIEQPKYSDASVSDNLVVSEVKTARGAIIAQQPVGGAATTSPVRTPAEQTGQLKFSGKAKPNDVVLLFIYSEMPIVVTLRTDENGNWVYDLDKTLAGGDHEAYVVVTDETGKIKSKSSPLAFFVKEAAAVTLAADDANAATNLSLIATPEEDPFTKKMIFWYMIYALALVSLSFFTFIFFSKLFRK